MSSITTKHFDERQLANRARANSSALWSLTAAVLLNAALFGSHPWGSPFQQALAMVFISTSVFSVQAIWTGAYFTSRRDAWVTVGTNLGIGLLNLAAVLIDPSQAWHDGRAGDTFTGLLLAVLFMVDGLVGLVRIWLDAREEARD